MRYFFKLIRWKNLLMIALVQYLIKYALLLPFAESHNVSTTLDHLHFFLLVIATISIAAGGYVVNDIQDIAADTVNKPNHVIITKHITENKATALFVILNIIGVGLGYYITVHSATTNLFPIFIVASALLYIYSTFLQHIVLIGNLVVAFMVALSLLLVGIFELLPAITTNNGSGQLLFLSIIRDYAIFAFLVSLIREMVKDIEDIDGDYKMGLKTLPIVTGRNRATKITTALSLLPLFTVTYYVIIYLFKQIAVVGYFLILVIAPLLYISIKLFSASQKADYKHISMVLKLVMLTGMLSMLLYNFILLN
ncbi:MAG: geranylgeranylglycerol-phosphate geranylgeranyltransferase [Winogradskyella sp.]